MLYGVPCDGVFISVAESLYRLVRGQLELDKNVISWR